MKKISYFILLTIFLLAGCETNPSSPSARQCQHGLKIANKELNFAKAKGFSGTVAYAKAATLLTGASIQYEFGKYPNCIDKVKRARRFIRNSQVEK
ncbi:MAG: hypothetical protein BMS9Abin31_1064 [Gammaproteobacteria bacterium]|nr:MAG: hypothetical protein BMS9Abin31_1064 [Gammaproteobacteria bacterium]